MEGDIEFNDEDVTANTGVITRRLNLTTNASGNFQSSFNNSQLRNSQIVSKDKKIYGEPARTLFLRSVQYILRAQCKWLVSNESYPLEYEHVVKLVWIEYLTHMSPDNDDTNNDAFSGDDTEVDNYYTTDEATQSDGTGYSRRRTRKNKISSTGLSITTTVAILYISAIRLRLPIFTSDFIRYICATKFPFFKANMILPKVWRTKLPNYYLGQLDGKKIPNNGQLIRKIVSTCAKIELGPRFCSTINTEGLVLKLLLDSNLPPEFFLSTLHLIKTMDGDTSLGLFGSDTRKFVTFYKFPEIRVISYFILSLRWTLMCAITKNGGYTYPTPWIKALMNKSGFDDTERRDTEKQITHLFCSKSRDNTRHTSENVFNWDETRTTDFLNWVERVYLTANDRSAEGETKDGLTIDQRIAKRKLEKIVPLQSDNFELSTISTSTDTFLDQLQNKFIQLNNIMGDALPENIRQEDMNERSRCISLLEEKLINNFSSSFGLSEEILKSSVLRLERHCISTMKHS